MTRNHDSHNWTSDMPEKRQEEESLICSRHSLFLQPFFSVSSFVSLFPHLHILQLLVIHGAGEVISNLVLMDFFASKTAI